MVRKCRECSKEKPLSKFYLRSSARQQLAKSEEAKYDTRCKKCFDAYRVKWSKANPEKGAEYNRKHRLGVSGEQYAEMVAVQDGKCAICGCVGNLHVDHNHSTGEIRSLLCGPCNRGLGLFHENANAIEAAAAYIRRWS